MPAGWSLPPAASPINTTDILHAVRAGFGQEKTVHDVKQSLHDYFGAAHVSLVSSGTGALCLALRALHAHYPARNRVLIPAYSCYSVPAAVEAAGLSAMLCDVDPQTLDFDYADLSFRLQQYADTLVAVVPIHLYGIPADINRIRALCRKYDIAIIEDAAQAMGATYEGKPAGMHGDIGVFSLGRGKALSAVEGGIVLTNDSRFAKTLDTLIGPLATYSTKQEWAILAKAVFMLFFLPPSRFWIPASMPFLHLGETVYQPLTTIKKMSGVQAGLLGEWYGKLAFFKKVRKSKAELWRRDVPVGVTAPDTLRRIDWGALLRYPVFIDNPRKRNGILAFSRKTGLGLAPGYPAPISSLSILDSSEKMRRLPGASACAEKLITLPNHQFVTRDAVNLTCALIAQTDSTSPGVDPQSI